MEEERKKRKMGRSDKPQFFNKLEINKDDLTITIQYDDEINENIIEPKEPDVYIKFKDHHNDSEFDQKLYLMEFMLMLKQYIIQVKDVESCGMCKYVRALPYDGPDTDTGVGVVQYPLYPHCSLKITDGRPTPIPLEDVKYIRQPEWCPCPDYKDRLEPSAFGLGPMPESDSCGCSSCGTFCGTKDKDPFGSGGGGHTIH